MSKDPIAIFMAQHEEGIVHLKELNGYIQRVERGGQSRGIRGGKEGYRFHQQRGESA